ncbi:MAG: sigma-54 dependent transcriptional regulator [Candidatus Krumholzibacteriia bacterium]
MLIVDDEVAIRETVAQILGYEGFRARTAASGPDALAALDEAPVDAVLLDIKMPGMDGFEVLARVRAEHPGVPVVVISGHGDIQTAVQAVKDGAYDFLEKPLDRARMLVTLQNAVAHRRTLADRDQLAAKAGRTTPLVGECPAMREVKAFIAKVAPSDSTVLVTGENGTGKEVVVSALHAASRRAAGPLVEVNCAAIPADLVESELFGHEKGAFTGADRQRIGKFEQADHGTLFLDEIGDMGPAAQAKVLRAVEEGTFQRVGGRESLKVDVRIVAATNRDLTDPASGFRRDLFFRLNVLAIHLPPLRERRGDVELLLDFFMARLSVAMKTRPRRFAPEALALLREYSWPGNVRELRNLVERLLILAPGETVRPGDLPMLTGAAVAETGLPDFFRLEDFQEFKSRAEAAFLQQKLREQRYNVSRTAEVLGMQRSNLYKKISRYGLQTQVSEEEI